MDSLVPISNDLILPPWWENSPSRPHRPTIGWPRTREEAERAAATIQKDAFDHGCLCARLQVDFHEWPDGRKAVNLKHGGGCPLLVSTRSN